MPGQKRSRQLRRMVTPAERLALDEARRERDRRFAELVAEVGPQIEVLQGRMRDGRRRIWAEYDHRCAMVGSATLLEPKAA